MTVTVGGSSGTGFGFSAGDLRLGADAEEGRSREDPSMFGTTYAVSWDDESGSRFAGCLELDERGVVLTGGSNCSRVEQAIPLVDIHDVQVRRGRLFLTRRSGWPMTIVSLDAPGVLHEIAVRLAARIQPALP